MSRTAKDWTDPEREQLGRGSDDRRSRSIISDALMQTKSTSQSQLDQPDTGIWLNPELEGTKGTANLDTQDPPTLYYLGKVVQIPEVVEVYVEKRPDGGRKHWAVISERDYEMMEKIYDIEEDTLDRFPAADLSFRVTVKTKEGPSVSGNSIKIYERK